ncbi:hypothetical protein L195_g054539, partial [Trifolium pratense]
DEECEDLQGKSEEVHLDKPDGILFFEGEPKEEVEWRPDTCSQVNNSFEISSNVMPGSQGGYGSHEVRTVVFSQIPDAQDRSTPRLLRGKRTNSCPSEARRSIISR